MAASLSRLERRDVLGSTDSSSCARHVKLVVLLEKVSLFIGTDFDRLTELQTSAESFG